MAPGAGKGVIRESGVGADEDVIPDAQAVPELHAVLDGDPIAHHHVILDEAVGADVAIPADAGGRENDDILPDTGSLPDMGRLDIGIGVNHGFHDFGSSAEFVGAKRRIFLSPGREERQENEGLTVSYCRGPRTGLFRSEGRDPFEPWRSWRLGEIQIDFIPE